MSVSYAISPEQCRRSGRAHILPVCLWASQARRTRHWPHYYISYFHCTYSGCCFVWEEGAIMWYSIVGVCLESWRGEAEFWQSSYGFSPNRAALFNGKNKSLLCRSEKYCRLYCDIVPKNGSFNSASFLKPRPAYHSHFFLAAALITYVTICWMYFEPKPLKVSVKEKLHNVLKNDICVDTWKEI